MKPIPDDAIIEQKYGPAMALTEEAAAKEYFEACVEHSMRVHGTTREEAEDCERQNLGYVAGYYDFETRVRVERLFSAKHPFFGSTEAGSVSVVDAFAIGEALGRKSRGELPS